MRLVPGACYCGVTWECAGVEKGEKRPVRLTILFLGAITVMLVVAGGVVDFKIRGIREVMS